MPRKKVECHKVSRHGRIRFRVLVPKELGGGTRYYKTQTDGNSFARELESRRGSTDSRLLSFESAQKALILTCIERLSGNVNLLGEAVDHFLKARAFLTNPKTLGEVVPEFVNAKRAGARRLRTILSYHYNLKLFLVGREAQRVCDVTTEGCHAYIYAGDYKPKSRETRFKVLSAFFAYCVKRGYMASNPMKGVDRPSLENKPPTILSVRSAAKLMAAVLCHDPGLALNVAIKLFAGVRPAEVRRLTPENLRAKWIEIDGMSAKTRRRRLVEIHPTLQAWLDLGGELAPVNYWKRFDEVRRLAGVKTPVDVLRHSFCSYALLQLGPARTALNAGHSEDVLFSNYRERVSMDESNAFWSLTPQRVLQLRLVELLKSRP